MHSADDVDELRPTPNVFVTDDEKLLDLGLIKGIGVLSWTISCPEREVLVLGDVVHAVGSVKLLQGAGG